MGVLKNDVGRPSNEELRLRKIIKLLVLIIIVGLILFAVNYVNSNKEEEKVNSKEKNEIKEITSKEKINELSKKVLNESQVEYLYFDKDTTIDNIENKSIIRFALAKYLEDNNIKLQDHSLECGDVDKDGNLVPRNENQTIRIEKNKIDKIIEDEFNTTDKFSMSSKEYFDLNSPNASIVIYDAKNENYHIISKCAGGSFTKAKNKIIKAEEDNEYAYLYSKMIICDRDSDLGTCGSPSNGYFKHTETGTFINNYIYSSDNINSNDLESSIDYVFEKYDEKIDTYKSTFKKVNDNYYWISTEIVK